MIHSEDNNNTVVILLQVDHEKRFGDGLTNVFWRLGQLGGLGERRQRPQRRRIRRRRRRGHAGWGRVRWKVRRRFVVVRVRAAVHRRAKRPDRQVAVELPEGEHAAVAGLKRLRPTRYKKYFRNIPTPFGNIPLKKANSLYECTEVQQ